MTKPNDHEENQMTDPPKKPPVHSPAVTAARAAGATHHGGWSQEVRFLPRFPVPMPFLRRFHPFLEAP
jgi:hypothetical protein